MTQQQLRTLEKRLSNMETYAAMLAAEATAARTVLAQIMAPVPPAKKVVLNAQQVTTLSRNLRKGVKRATA